MKRYFAEFNRAKGDNIRITAKSLNRQGLRASLLPHKTSLMIERPKSMPWTQFTGTVRAVLHPRRGSVMISSEYSGKTFICQNSGNRPGRFQCL